jgi:hypothetical protein
MSNTSITMKASVAYEELKKLERKQQNLTRLIWKLENKDKNVNISEKNKDFDVDDNEIDLLKDILNDIDKKIKDMFDAMNKVSIELNI